MSQVRGACFEGGPKKSTFNMLGDLRSQMHKVGLKTSAYVKYIEVIL